MNGDLSQVVESEMCIGCGACIAADDSLELVFDQVTQMWQPSAGGSPDAVAVCPAIGVDFDDLHRTLFPDQAATSFGVVEKVLLSQSTNFDRNRDASSGGLIKELLLRLLDDAEIEGVIALTRVERIDYRARLAREPSKVDSLPGSIYHQVRFDDALRILRETDGRFVLVGIPCQLEGIYGYILRLEPQLLSRIHTTVGLICGWLYTHHALRALASYAKTEYQDVEDVSYRGGGPVGKLRLQTADSEVVVSRRVNFGYQVAFDRSFNVRRCHVCVNHSNFLADIVIGDAWLPATVMSRTGVSLVICRRPSTVDLINDLVELGHIRVASASTDDIVESQTRRVVYGDFAYAYSAYLRSIGLHTPEMEGPNRAAAALEDPRDVAKFHRRSTVKRDLQKRQAYRRIWWRKLLTEIGPLSMRYLRWFFVRVLRVKSLFGSRTEISSSELEGFL